MWGGGVSFCSAPLSRFFLPESLKSASSDLELLSWRWLYDFKSPGVSQGAHVLGVYGEGDWVGQPTDGCPLPVGMPVHLPSVGVHSQQNHSAHGQSQSLKPLDHKRSLSTSWGPTTLRERVDTEDEGVSGPWEDASLHGAVKSPERGFIYGAANYVCGLETARVEMRPNQADEVSTLLGLKSCYKTDLKPESEERSQGPPFGSPVGGRSIRVP
ncbi:uncharacterized protein LOC123933384 isoform X1 [Meles meles]|uniref:uncharacterized protein LOC123933384 isoform X1 n=1 Tax=Meles meles TaxID=9662 RepID=UPI001E69DEC8|nr:uncharacterized protein LOC123933384 isoform X1 [Meles meles]